MVNALNIGKALKNKWESTWMVKKLFIRQRPKNMKKKIQSHQ